MRNIEENAKYMRLWGYTGTAIAYGNMVMAIDRNDYNKAPLLLLADAGMMGYINDFDDFPIERGLRKIIIYNDFCRIVEIRVMNADGEVCKIVRETSDPRIVEYVGTDAPIFDEKAPKLQDAGQLCEAIPII